MDIFSFSTQDIDIGKIKCGDSRYLEVLNLEFELPELECINGVCQKMNPTIKKDIYFIDVKLDNQHHQEIISRLLEIENKIIDLLESVALDKINFFFNETLTSGQIKSKFKSCLLGLNDNTSYLRIKIPHDNIKFTAPIEDESQSFFEDIKFGKFLKGTVSCPGIWFSNNRIGLSWNISKIIL